MAESVCDMDDADEGIVLSDKVTVDGVEYYKSLQNDNVVLFSMAGEPVGVLQDGVLVEAEFGDSDDEE